MLPMNFGALALEELAVLVFPNKSLRVTKRITQHCGVTGDCSCSAACCRRCLTSVHVCWRTLDCLAPRKLYRIVILSIFLPVLTCICLTAGVNLLTPSTVRFMTSSQRGLTCVGAECGKEEGGMDHTSVAVLTNQLCSDRGVVPVFEYSINVLYYKYGRNQSWRY